MNILFSINVNCSIQNVYHVTYYTLRPTCMTLFPIPFDVDIGISSERYTDHIWHDRNLAFMHFNSKEFPYMCTVTIRLTKSNGNHFTYLVCWLPEFPNRFLIDVKQKKYPDFLFFCFFLSISSKTFRNWLHLKANLVEI